MITTKKIILEVFVLLVAISTQAQMQFKVTGVYSMLEEYDMELLEQHWTSDVMEWHKKINHTSKEGNLRDFLNIKDSELIKYDCYMYNQHGKMKRQLTHEKLVMARELKKLIKNIEPRKKHYYKYSVYKHILKTRVGAIFTYNHRRNERLVLEDSFDGVKRIFKKGEPINVIASFSTNYKGTIIHVIIEDSLRQECVLDKVVVINGRGSGVWSEKINPEKVTLGVYNIQATLKDSKGNIVSQNYENFEIIN